ncbi:uncharacterized protein LOC126672558 [Mercurialis annua]|uniref:uncharacterized protein LOC126672558 n=1 Tax=Mercurialis annua TaxID=3986 RepID=UPI00215EF2E8|nr:uncharacterized protein LOC126672558 [Mercurialis annua]
MVSREKIHAKRMYSRFSVKNLEARRKVPRQISFEEINNIPLQRRTNIRSLAAALDMLKSMVQRRVKEGSIRSHSNALKPFLTDENKKERLQFCISMIDQDTIHSRPMFNDMYNYVHIDEKWFYMTKVSNKYYLHPEENEPMRTCKSKRFISKVMFLAVVARPRITSFGLIFSGKIDIFPFIYKEVAKRKSKNRVAGTLETKAIENINKDVMHNAKPHINVNDTEFLEEAGKDGFDIRLSFQPPNSPDLNILDLGFFRAIQALQHQKAPRTIDELVVAVEDAFNELLYKNIDSGQLPTRLNCDPVVLNRATSFLQTDHMEGYIVNFFFVMSGKNQGNEYLK